MYNIIHNILYIKYTTKQITSYWSSPGKPTQFGSMLLEYAPHFFLAKCCRFFHSSPVCIAFTFHYTSISVYVKLKSPFYYIKISYHWIYRLKIYNCISFNHSLYIYIITYYITYIYIYILYKLNCCWHHHLSWWFTSPASPMEPPARGIEGDWNPLLRSLEIWKFAISFVASKCLKNHSTDFLGVLCFQYHGLSITWSNPGSISNNLQTWHKRHFGIILPTNQSHVGWRRG